MRSNAPALLPIFRSDHQAGLLSRMFLTNDEVPMTDLARSLAIALPTLHREVERLEEADLLTSRRIGRTRIIRANTTHPAARSLTDLLMVAFGPAHVIAQEFAGLGADAVIIFGSWARRYAGETGRFPRDIDVLVIGEHIDRTAVYGCADVAQKRIGLPVNTTIRTQSAWDAIPSDPLVTDMRRHGFLQVLPSPPTSTPASASLTLRHRPPQCLYQLRPSWTPRYQPDVYVPSDLHMLTGPTSGRLDPPVNLYWQPGRIDFANRADVELFYSSALTAANTTAHFAQWINHQTLLTVWNTLSLPRHTRHAWETIHPGLRNENTVNDRILIQDSILAAIADHGFALAGGSALIDYDIVTRDSDDIDAFSNHWDTNAFNAAHNAILRTCHDHGWQTQTTMNQDFRKQVLVNAGTGQPVTVDIVYYERSHNPEHRAGGGLRLVFSDVVAGKGVAVADSARGRDFDDLAHIVDTPGWSLAHVEDAMRAIKYGDMIDRFRTNLERFRRGEFDADIRKSGFDPAFSHRILD